MCVLWKGIVGFGNYEVSNYGDIRNITTGHFRKLVLTRKGYHTVDFSVGKKHYNFKVHRLVALHFISNPNNYPQVNHKNGIKSDNYIDNLEWCTNSMNTLHSFRVLGRIHPALGKFGSNSLSAKSVKQYSLSGDFICMYGSIIEASKQTNTSSSNISLCANNLRANAGGYVWKFN